jgi:uncharacterized membrane protein YoaK (UPF0700 family)
MFKHRFHEHVGLTVHFNWFLLSFLAGNINAGGFLSCQRFVSHLTGFATLVGIDFALNKIADAFALVSIPIYFLGGVMIAGYFTDARMAKGRQPLYSVIMLLVTLCLAMVTIAGRLNWFGPFGQNAVITDDYLLLALLCGCCGLQNGAITVASGATFRTTHLTGMTTDLGLGIVRSFFSKDDPKRHYEMTINARRVISISSFMLGSAIGAAFYIKYEYSAFLIPTLIALYLTLFSLFELRRGRNEGKPVKA